MKESLHLFGRKALAGAGIAVGIIGVLLLVLLGLRLWVRDSSPSETVKTTAGTTIQANPLHFHKGKMDTEGTLYSPSAPAQPPYTAIIYCQNRAYGARWCKELAGAGYLSYAFDMTDGATQRSRQLRTVVEGIRGRKDTDRSKVYLLAEGNGCRAATLYAMDNPGSVAGLILISPGFNPLEISRKAKNYRHPVLVLDETRGQKELLEEIRQYVN